MVAGPVGQNQSYWGLIRVSGEMAEAKLEAFKGRLQDFLDREADLNARLVNGTIKADDATDSVSIKLIERRR